MAWALFKCFFSSVLLLLLAAAPAFASELDAHPGYLISVEGERYQLSREVIIMPDTVAERLTLNQRIFTDKLSKDFQSRYEDQFGRSQAEQLDAIPMRFYERELKPGVYVTEEQYIEKQQRFGNYMGKRLLEHHVDNYMRENPEARPILELKEKVSNVSMTVKQGYKVRFKYSFSGNYLDVKLENPYNIEAKVTLEDMGDDDAIASLGYPVTKSIKIVADYRDYRDQSTLSATKTLSPKLSTSVSALSNNLENKGIVSVRWVD
jgi:hypothetical protein